MQILREDFVIDPLADHFRFLFGIVQIAFGKNDNKFFSTPSGDDITVSNNFLNQNRDADQHFIPDFMSIGIIDFFEIIYIEQNNAQRVDRKSVV